MRGQYLYSLFVLTLFSPSCYHRVSTQPLRALQRSEDLASTQSPEQFWEVFRAALKNKDISKISFMTRFPLHVGSAGVEEFEGIEHQEGFERHYSTVFSKAATRTLLNETPQPRNSDCDLNGSAMESWSIAHNHQNKISEDEWSIIYCFSRLADGDIKLTAIHFAG